jgi:hypothetical protein
MLYGYRWLAIGRHRKISHTQTDEAAEGSAQPLLIGMVTLA